jgi:uncharacterized protein (DUF2249 family)
MRFDNDHDPIPLLNQLHTRYGGSVEATYRERNASGVKIELLRR